MSASTSLTCRCAASVGAVPVCVLGIDDNVVLLDVDRERLGDVGAGDALAALDGHVVALDARLAGPHERLPGGEVVLPAMPRAGQQRRLGLHAELARAARQRPRRDSPSAQRPALMRAAVADPVEAIADAEDADRPAADRDDAPVAWLELGDGGDDDPHAAPRSPCSRSAHMSDKGTRYRTGGANVRHVRTGFIRDGRSPVGGVRQAGDAAWIASHTRIAVAGM